MSSEDKYPKPQQSESQPAPTKPNNNGNGSLSSSSNPGQKARFPNPPESFNPDPATLRDQWRFAIRQYSKWYSHAWGTAILAGGAFFALGWVIKGGNPLPSREKHPSQSQVDDDKS